MNEWKEYKLGDITEIVMGQSPAGISCNTEGIGIPLLNGPTEFSTRHPYAVQYTIDPKRYSKTGDILFCVRGSTTGKMNWSDKEYAIGRGIAAIRHKAEKKAQYFIKGILDYYLPVLLGGATGSTFPNIAGDALRDFEIEVPPLCEQIHISSILSSLDDKIDLLQRQNKTLEQLAETIFRQWFVEEADESWEVITVDEEFEFVMGQSPHGSTLNEDKNGMIFYQGRSDFGFRFPKARVYTTEPNRIAKKFDTLVSVRAPVGDMNMSIEECCLGRGVAAFRYKRNNSFYSYTYYKMRSLMGQIKQFEDNGSVFGSIGKEDFMKLENMIPSDEIITKFQIEVKPIDNKIYLNTIQIKRLTLLRDTLLPKLMSGEVSINN